jgi:hypothetical protein
MACSVIQLQTKQMKVNASNENVAAEVEKVSLKLSFEPADTELESQTTRTS